MNGVVLYATSEKTLLSIDVNESTSTALSLRGSIPCSSKKNITQLNVEFMLTNVPAQRLIENTCSSYSRIPLAKHTAQYPNAGQEQTAKQRTAKEQVESFLKPRKPRRLFCCVRFVSQCPPQSVALRCFVFAIRYIFAV